MAKLRYSVAVTTLIVGLIAQFEVTLQMFPYIIPYTWLRFLVAGSLPLFVTFLYQEEEAQNPGVDVTPEPLPPPPINAPVGHS